MGVLQEDGHRRQSFPPGGLGYANPSYWSGWELAAATLFFALQIYCDFSAYSDIAIGVARLLGFELMRNFACPYFAQSMGEFWRRWHISLTTWFKDYVYFPLGGSHVGAWRQTFNVLITFLLSGLWHGASWNFLVWGALNGIAVVLEKLAGIPAARNPENNTRAVAGLRIAARTLITFGVVCLGWIFFRARTLPDALLIVRDICGGLADWSKAGQFFQLAYFSPLSGWIFILLTALIAVEWSQRAQPHPLRLGSWPRPARWTVYVGLTWLILYAGTFGGTQFIYFQF